MSITRTDLDNIYIGQVPQYTQEDALQMLRMKTYSKWFDSETREHYWKRNHTDEQIIQKYDDLKRSLQP